MRYVFKFLILSAVLFFNSYVQAQNYTVSGYIKDASSGEMLLGANLYITKMKTGATANNYGFYSITLPKDSHYIVFSFIGYKPQVKKLYLNANTRLNIALEPVGYEHAAVEVTANKKAVENVERAQMSVIDVPIQMVKDLPAIFGEKDLLKVLQLLPGVQSGSEATAGFYVRGGGPDQNLILLDEATIYNPFHLAGFFSTFNGDAIKSVSLIKGGFPAQYGGRLSSIIDISMKDGNDKEYHGEGGVGLISSRLTLEGPIVKEKATFMISGRRTYLDVLTKPLLPEDESFGYFFYDLNTKLNYKLSDKDRFFISSYLGSDVFSAEQRGRNSTTAFGVNWGNKSVTGRWNHLFSDKLFANTTFIYNDYLFKISSKENNLAVQLTSGIKDVQGKIDFDWFPQIRHRVKFGASHTYQQFIPSTVQGQIGSSNQIINQQIKYVHQSAVYINDEYTVSDRTSINIGLRSPFFIYKNTTYFNLEPRFTAKYSLDKRTSIKFGYTWMNQFVHLVSNSTLATPMDIWVPSSDIVKPQKAQQVAAGIFRNFNNNRYETSFEVYYKDMRNLIEYRPGAQIFFNPEIDKEFLFGRGWSYGGEFFVKKNEGKITGWVGYTLAWANRQFDGINGGKTFPAKYDRRHDFSLTGVYNFNKNWSFSMVFVYGSGHSLTVPFGVYPIPVFGYGGGGMQGFDYIEKNFYKLRAYNRMDIGIKYIKENKRFTSEWRFDIYNVYSRRNPYFVYLATEYDERANINKPVAKQVSLFPMVPSVSYNFKF